MGGHKPGSAAHYHIMGPSAQVASCAVRRHLPHPPLRRVGGLFGGARRPLPFSDGVVLPRRERWTVALVHIRSLALLLVQSIAHIQIEKKKRQPASRCSAPCSELAPSIKTVGQK